MEIQVLPLDGEGVEFSETDGVKLANFNLSVSLQLTSPLTRGDKNTAIRSSPRQGSWQSQTD